MEIYKYDPLVPYTDSLLQLQEDTWKTLSKDEKASLLKTIAEIEYTTLGIEQNPVLVFSPLEKDTGGVFTYNDETITISMDELLSSSSEELINTICHESFHAYEHQLMELYSATDDKHKNLIIFKNVPKYIEESENYISRENDFPEYYKQQIEIDAREYASKASKHYINWGIKKIEEDQALYNLMEIFRDWNTDTDE